MKLTSLLLFLAVFALVLGGCKDDDNPAGPATGATSYVGVMAGTGVTGSLTINIPSHKPAWTTGAAAGDTVVISATLKINGGATVPLAGYYVISTGDIYLAGGGYTFFGTLEEGTISGNFTYAGGNGIFNCEEGNSSSVKTYCGSYHENEPGTESGSFNMTIEGTAITLIVYPNEVGGTYFLTTGAINAEHQITIFSPENGSLVIATGTLNVETGAVSGIYYGDPGGTWSGAPCN